jgi:hypothetical protein
MKKIYIFPFAAVVLVGALSFQRSGNFTVEKYLAKNGHQLNANGAGSGQAGAPGEQNCTSCHSGTALSGSSENVLLVLNGATPTTSYVPGASYTVALSMSSNPAKKGFQATALSASNAMAGTFVASTNTQINGTTKKYANHTSTSNTSTTLAWAWTWTAPSTDVGDVTFYVATNKTNNNNNNSGDAIYLSQHVIASTLGVQEEENVAANFSAGYSSSTNSLALNFTTLSAGEMNLNLVDLSGKSVFTYNMGNALVGENSEKIVLPADLKSGIYIVNFFVNNKAMSSKVMIQK